MAPIAGAVAGGVVGLALVGVLWSFLAKQGIMGHQSGFQVNHDNNEAGGQGEKPSGQPFSPAVGPHGSEYAPNAGPGPSAGFGGDGVGSAGAGSAGAGGAGVGSAGAGAGSAGAGGVDVGGAQGAGIGENPFAPEIQSYGPGGVYPGAGVGSDPVYTTSAAGYDTGAVVGGYYIGQGLRQNRGSSGYVERSHDISPGGIQQQFPLPHSISYSPQGDTAAAGASYPSQTNAPHDRRSGPLGARHSPPNLRMSTISEEMGKGVGTGLPSSHSPTSTSDLGNPLAKQYARPPPASGWSGLPEAIPHDDTR